MMTQYSRLVSVAPMMDWTNRHFRNFIRIMSKHTFLYTEMITTGAILHGDTHKFLDYDAAEHPLGLQLGGSNAAELVQCAKIAERYGYDEINLNIGCPSDRVQSGSFGACLMKSPELVKQCCQALLEASHLPITIKCRIGVDEHDSYEYFRDFIGGLAETGIEIFIIHARKAWLKGLSPKQNRTIPPLKYDYVTRLKQEFPQLTLIINGGLTDINAAVAQFPSIDGIMLGRAAYQNPYIFAAVDHDLFGASAIKSRQEIMLEYINYARRQFSEGESCTYLFRYCLGLYQGRPGAKTWRRHLSQFNHRTPATPDDLLSALKIIETAQDSEQFDKS